MQDLKLKHVMARCEKSGCLVVAAGLKLADGGSLIYDEAAEMLLRVTDSSISMHSLAQPQQAPRVGLYIPHPREQEAGTACRCSHLDA